MRYRFCRLLLLLSFLMLVGRVESADAVIGSVDTPGYARWVKVSGSYAYVADDYAGLQVVDISNPKSPAIVGSVDTPGNAKKLFISGSYAYVADYWDGFHVVDITIPASPAIVGSLSLPDAAEGVYVSGSYAYVADGSSGLKIIDVSNPGAPAIVGGVNTIGYSHDITVSGSYAYVADGSKGLVVIDITDPAAPMVSGNAATPGTAKGVSVSWPYVYIAADDNGIQVVNVADPQKPKIVGSLLTSGTCQSVYLVYPLLFVAADVNGLRVVDVSNPVAPYLRGTEVTSSFALGVYVVEGYAYMADYDFGLEVVDVRKYFSRIVGSVDTPGNAQDVKVSGSYAYVADDFGGLQVIDVGKPAVPVIVGSLATPGNAKGVFVAGSYAYVAEDASGLLVVNIDNPQNPTVVGSVETPGPARAVFVSGSCAYVADGSGGGLQVIDVSDPEDPVIMGDVTTPGSAESVQVVGPYAFVADGSGGGLQIIDVSVPQSPAIVGSLNTTGAPYEVDLSGSLAYVADGSNGLTVVDLTSLDSPIVVGGLETDSSARGIRVRDSYAFLATYVDGLNIFDISDPFEPFLIVAVDTTGYANKVDLSGSYAYVADGPSGLQIIGIANFPCDQQAPAAPAAISYPAGDTDGTFVVTWQPSSLAQTYALQRANNTSFTGAISVYDGASTSFEQAGLFAGTFYYRVRAANDCGASGWTVGTGINVSSFPPRPGGISYAASSCGSNFAISWTASTGATSYLLQRAADPSFSGAATVYSGSQTSHTEPSLSYGTYYYQVRASNAKGVSPWRAGGATTVVATPPVPDTFSYPTGSCNGSLAIAWAAVSGANGYTLQRATNPAFGDAVQVYLGPANAYSDSGIPGGTYYYRVRANNACGSSTWKSGSGASVSSIPPAPAEILYPSANCGSTFTINWSSVAGATEYTLQRATTENFSSATNVYSGALTSFVQPTLGSGTYYYRVRAGNACGTGTWTGGSAITVTSLPDTPDTITYPQTLCGSSITLSWASASRATSYILQKATNASFSGATEVYSGPATSFGDTGLLNGSYYYRVKAANDCGGSSWRSGTAVSVTTPPPPPETISYPGNTCSGSFTVTWATVAGVTGYALQRATSPSFADATTVYTGLGSSSNQTGLTDGTYYFRVRAGNGCGEGGWKDGAAIVVASLPAMPGTLSYPPTNCGTAFTVNWTSVTGATNYILQRATNATFTDAADVFTGSSTSFSQAVLPAASYYYRVRAGNGCGLSNWQQGSAIVVTSTPSKPATITYPPTNCTGSFTVSWASVSGASSYTLQRAKDPSFSDAVTVFTNSGTSFAQTGLAEGTYYYQVRANNDCGNSSWKTGTAMTVTGTLLPPAVISYPAGSCSGAFRVTWDAVNTATGYTLQRAINAAFTDAQNVYTGTAMFFDQTALGVGTYYYRVLASSSCGNSSWQAGPAMIVTTTPGAPGSITYPTGNCGGTFTVTWPQVNGATSYLLQRASNVAFAGATQVYSGAGTSFQESSLSVGTYYYRVLAKNDCGSSGWAAGAPVVVTAAPPAPAGISYSPTTCNGTVAVSWSAVSGATFYTLQRATSPNFSDATTVYSGAAVSFDQAGLANGTYYFQVRAGNDCGTGGWKTGPAVAVTALPPAPGSLSYPSGICGVTFMVSWAEAQGATSYALQRATDSTFANAVTVYNGASSFCNETVPGSGTFYYRVRASNGCGTGAWKTGQAVAATSAPASPVSITYPSTSCSGNYTVNWAAVDGATNYVVQRSMDPSFGDTVIVYSGLATSYVEPGLGLGTFYYRVRATNGCGTGDWRTGGAVAIASSPPPSPPATISYPAGSTGGSFTVMWSAVADAAGYTLQRAATASFSGAIEVYTGTANSVSQSGLPNGTYYYRVRANSDCGNSGWQPGNAIVVSGNRPPVVSAPPQGPAIGTSATSYTFTASASDPDGNPIQYRFSWGDGKTSAWSTKAYRSHQWSVSNTYCVKAQAMDSQGAVSAWSECATIVVSRPPVLTGPPVGPPTGKIGISCKFIGQATDPDGDPIQYRFSWGDGKTSAWATKATASHTWRVPATYCVKLQAIDNKGLKSSWSGCTNILIGE